MTDNCCSAAAAGMLQCLALWARLKRSRAVAGRLALPGCNLWLLTMLGPFPSTLPQVFTTYQDQQTTVSIQVRLPHYMC